MSVEQSKPGFNREELTLGYVKWKELSEARRPSLHPLIRRWLGCWNMWDLACSPMDDKERAQIRYGHYLGYLYGVDDQLEKQKKQGT